MCDTCWEDRNPDREPVRVTHNLSYKAEICAWCGQPTAGGIYVRQDPTRVRRR
jgi:hypothetical protein